MTDFRALCFDLLTALAWVNKKRKLPKELGFDELEQRAGEALKVPEEEPQPLIEFPEPRPAQKLVPGLTTAHFGPPPPRRITPRYTPAPEGYADLALMCARCGDPVAEPRRYGALCPRCAVMTGAA